jgi:methionine-rich copper-binding protein CopC
MISDRIARDLCRQREGRLPAVPEVVLLGRRLSLSVAVAALVFLLPSSVVAHAALISASPGPDDVISDVPNALVAKFTQNLDPDRSSIEVHDASGRVARGGYDATAPDKRTMRVALPDLALGSYQVRWTTLSTEDGELDRDTYTFTVVAPSPSPTPTPTSTLASTSPTPTAPPTIAATSSPRPSPEPSPTADAAQLAIPIIAALALVAGFAVWLRSRSVR